jgi:hypothetical protein
MKPKKLKTLTTFLLLLPLCVVLLGAGCDDENLWEISPDSKSSIIQKEVDGIEFKFCLLNEDGEAATVFNEGENFSFHFSVINNRNEKLYFYPGFAYSNDNDFCRIYDSADKNLGKPFNFIGVELIGIGGFPFDTSEAYIFEQLWEDNRDTIWHWHHGNYESTKPGLLTVGNYHTGFKYRFEFARSNDAPTLYTDTLSFKISFEIQ